MPAPDVSTEIRILSAFLGHKHINWRPDEIDHVKNPSSDSITKDGNLSAKPYFHLANLLNIQKDIVTAVTGTIDRPDTAAVIVYSTNSRSSTAKSKSEGAFRSGRTIKAKFLSMDALEKEILYLPRYVMKSILQPNFLIIFPHETVNSQRVIRVLASTSMFRISLASLLRPKIRGPQCSMFVI